jgi:hypothetical protein
MLNEMNFVMRDLMKTARLLKYAQSMQPPSMVNNMNVGDQMGPTSNYQPGTFDMLAMPALMATPFLGGVGRVLGAGLNLAMTPGQVNQGFDSFKQWLPSAGAFRKDVVLPSSF